MYVTRRAALRKVAKMIIASIEETLFLMKMFVKKAVRRKRQLLVLALCEGTLSAPLKSLDTLALYKSNLLLFLVRTKFKKFKTNWWNRYMFVPSDAAKKLSPTRTALNFCKIALSR